MIDIVQCQAGEKVKAYVKELGFSAIISKKDIKIKEGSTEDENRKFVSNRNNDILMNPELKTSEDNLHYRRSGLNDVIAKIASNNNVAVGFGFSYVLNSDGIERAKIIGRMKQNVVICRKTKTQMVICSYANGIKEMRGAKDLLAFARIIGMTGGEANKALNWKKKEKGVVFVS